METHEYRAVGAATNRADMPHASYRHAAQGVTGGAGARSCANPERRGSGSARAELFW